MDRWEGRRQASYPPIHSPFALRFFSGQAAVFDRLKMVLQRIEQRIGDHVFPIISGSVSLLRATLCCAACRLALPNVLPEQGELFDD